MIASTLDEALTQYIQTEIAQYQQLLGFVIQEQSIKLNVAGSAKNQLCDEWQFDRPKSDQPPLGRISYRIKCLAPSNWTGRAVAEISLWTDVVVANRAIDKDENLTADAITLASQDLANINRQPLFSLDEAIGRSAKRRIRNGDIISPFLLNSPQLINRGDLVVIQINIDGFSASTQGTALSDARVGERVKVQNTSSGKIVEGVVLASGQVLVDFIGN
ncbi:flagellar basal body P-ring formation chaperone FlgA [Shewanella sp. A25]|nr:flagellar basal body P-ring formation chaperone FlgA [Shewanella shenzhenensis]